MSRWFTRGGLRGGAEVLSESAWLLRSFDKTAGWEERLREPPKRYHQHERGA